MDSYPCTPDGPVSTGLDRSSILEVITKAIHAAPEHAGVKLLLDAEGICEVHNKTPAMASQVTATVFMDSESNVFVTSDVVPGTMSFLVGWHQDLGRLPGDDSQSVNELDHLIPTNGDVMLYHPRNGIVMSKGGVAKKNRLLFSVADMDGLQAILRDLLKLPIEA